MSASPTEQPLDDSIVLVDTCVISYVSKPADSRCAPYRRLLAGKTVAISFVTIAEIYSGILKQGIGEKRQAEIEERLRVAVKVPLDDNVCRKFAELGVLKNSKGQSRTMETQDRWIAACALAHGLPLVTHNRKHFEDIPGLRIIYENDALPLFKPDDSESVTI